MTELWPSAVFGPFRMKKLGKFGWKSNQLWMVNGHFKANGRDQTAKGFIEHEQKHAKENCFFAARILHSTKWHRPLRHHSWRRGHPQLPPRSSCHQRPSFWRSWPTWLCRTLKRKVGHQGYHLKDVKNYQISCLTIFQFPKPFLYHWVNPKMQNASLPVAYIMVSSSWWSPMSVLMPASVISSILLVTSLTFGLLNVCWNILLIPILDQNKIKSVSP